ncbi:uncharacterized protein YegJ (DUF2314 family) [Chitinophaga terrae (ex Kim and Jung 2007)]|uniref:DUF2314 domain-containing protein n=1 Tax=Chitinophaga terrae (ex Kim and Jung 2007) TaxID=408074 RepID=UPI0027863557|nr:DUF2314 domain-containing protein [Chitinophaga terrae (ex Kim and Jung 2007)]MDQ0107419.1 uncharacterized protein YegJ (DUF2314 family) [Chitinophaga terrae (ex Kim and Jung 2007)]
MSDTPIYFAEGDSPQMIAAFQKAQDTFRYFWRELSWEYRRIIPGLDLACVKAAFSQELPGRIKPVVEHMWINEIDFDGEMINGTLVNQPNELTNVNNGDRVSIPLTQISDWLFAIGGDTYGGFTIQAMRAMMPPAERREHDSAWGLNFGDYNDILLVNNQKTQPENLVEHPMSRNMKAKLEEFLQQHPGEVNGRDENGYTMLHRETIAGNLTSVEVLLQQGADKNAVTNSGKTALDFARKLKWEHLIPVLEK